MHYPRLYRPLAVIILGTSMVTASLICSDMPKSCDGSLPRALCCREPGWIACCMKGAGGTFAWEMLECEKDYIGGVCRPGPAGGICTVKEEQVSVCDG